MSFRLFLSCNYFQNFTVGGGNAIHHGGYLQIEGLIGSDAEALRESPVPMVIAQGRVFHVSERPVLVSGEGDIVVISTVNGRPGNIGVISTFGIAQIFWPMGRIGVIFHLAQRNGQVLGDLLHQRNGDGKILLITISRSHTDQLPVAVEEPTSAAAMGNDGRGGDDILIEAYDDACGFLVSAAVRRPDGGDCIADGIGCRDGSRFQTGFADFQKSNICFWVKTYNGRLPLIDRAVIEQELGRRGIFDHVKVGGDQSIRREDYAAALHFVGLDIDHGILGAYHADSIRCDGNGGSPAIPADISAAVFRQKSKGYKGAAVFQLSRSIDGNRFAVHTYFVTAQGQGNSRIFVYSKNSLGMALPIDRIAQRFQDASHGYQHAPIIDEGLGIEGNGFSIQIYPDSGCRCCLYRTGA